MKTSTLNEINELVKLNRDLRSKGKITEIDTQQKNIIDISNARLDKLNLNVLKLNENGICHGLSSLFLLYCHNNDLKGFNYLLIDLATNSLDEKQFKSEVSLLNTLYSPQSVKPKKYNQKTNARLFNHLKKNVLSSKDPQVNLILDSKKNDRFVEKGVFSFLVSALEADKLLEELLNVDCKEKPCMVILGSATHSITISFGKNKTYYYNSNDFTIEVDSLLTLKEYLLQDLGFIEKNLNDSKQLLSFEVIEHRSFKNKKERKEKMKKIRQKAQKKFYERVVDILDNRDESKDKFSKLHFQEVFEENSSTGKSVRRVENELTALINYPMAHKRFVNILDRYEQLPSDFMDRLLLENTSKKILKEVLGHKECKISLSTLASCVVYNQVDTFNLLKKEFLKRNHQKHFSSKDLFKLMQSAIRFNVNDDMLLQLFKEYKKSKLTVFDNANPFEDLAYNCLHFNNPRILKIVNNKLTSSQKEKFKSVRSVWRRPVDSLFPMKNNQFSSLLGLAIIQKKLDMVGLIVELNPNALDVVFNHKGKPMMDALEMMLSVFPRNHINDPKIKKKVKKILKSLMGKDFKLTQRHYDLLKSSQWDNSFAKSIPLVMRTKQKEHRYKKIEKSSKSKTQHKKIKRTN